MNGQRQTFRCSTSYDNLSCFCGDIKVVKMYLLPYIHDSEKSFCVVTSANSYFQRKLKNSSSYWKTPFKICWESLIRNRGFILCLQSPRLKMAWFIRFSDKNISFGNYCPNLKTLSFTSLNLKRGRIPSNLINSCPMKLIMADRMGQILGEMRFC